MRTAVAGAFLCLPALPAMAADDPLIEGARQCTQYFPVEERNNSIPTHLLAAIATTESGRYHEGLGMSVPWPWTINVEGKGYFFKSKAEAIAQTQNFLAKGYQSIDVGCMQVNLKHHPKAFANLNQAFDPSTNVAYAAKFLRTNYATLGDWIRATAAYHSRTPVHGNRYLGDIERSWNRIVAKVAAARASKSGDAQQLANAVGDDKAVAPRKLNSEVKPRIVGVSRMAEAKRARVIQVSDVPKRRASEVVVVRAPSAPVTPVTVAEAAPLVDSNPPAGNSIRRVSLDNSAGSGVANSANPQFVFAN
jgi:hypothetical protein